MDDIIPVHLSVQSESRAESHDQEDISAQSESRAESHDQDATPIIQITPDPSTATGQNDDTSIVTSPLPYQRQLSHPSPSITMIRQTLHGNRRASMHTRPVLPGDNTKLTRSVSYMPQATPNNDPSDLSETLPPSECVCYNIIIS